MSLKKTLLAGAAGVVLAGSSAMASEPVQLTDNQMDDVTAGFLFAFASTGGFASQFGSANDDGSATFEEIATTFQRSTSSVTIKCDGSGGGSNAESAEAFSSIFGTFDNVTLGVMQTGGTLSFTGRFPGLGG